METWRAIPGFEDRYEVSDAGRVRSLRLRGRHKGGAYDRPRPAPIVLRPYPAPEGYMLVDLGKGVRRSVHRLVLTTFVGPCPVGHEGAHENGRRADNRLENLTWKTPAENAADKHRHGTMLVGDRHYARLHPEKLARGDRNGRRHHPERYPRGDESWPRLHPERLARGDKSGARLHPERVPRGERHGMAKLNEAAVIAIRSALARGERRRDLAATHGVAVGTIDDIATGRRWRHLLDARSDRLACIDPHTTLGEGDIEQHKAAAREAIRATVSATYGGTT